MDLTFISANMFSKDQFTHCKLGHDEGSESSTADHTVIRVSSSEEDHLNTNNNRKSLSEKLTSISNSRCLTASFSSLILFTLILISVVLGRQYIIDILIYIDSLDVAESTVLFAVMFTVVAFPIMWGYVLLNVACGYTYGFKFGTLITSGCAAYAILCAHLIIRKFFKVGIHNFCSLVYFCIFVIVLNLQNRQMHTGGILIYSLKCRIYNLWKIIGKLVEVISESHIS